ncbi:unnamed protein product, partial [marine sediment metagenome]
NREHLRFVRSDSEIPPDKFDEIEGRIVKKDLK